MKVNHSGYSQYLEKSYNKNKESTVNKSSEAFESFGKDRIEISNSSKEIKMYFDKMKDSEINIDRVKRIRDAIHSGTYPISSEELADNIIKKMKE